VDLDRDKAAAYYERSLEAFPGKERRGCRVAHHLGSYIERKPEAQILEAFSPSTQALRTRSMRFIGWDAPRSARETRNMPGVFLEGGGAFPGTYFGYAASARLAPSAASQ